MNDNTAKGKNKVEDTRDPLYTIRKKNLNFLIHTKAKSQQSFADIVGTSTSYLSQIRSCQARSVGGICILGDSLARKIEVIFGLDTGYMDVEHDYGFLLREEQKEIGKIHSDLNTVLLSLVEVHKNILDKCDISEHVIAHHLEIATNALNNLKKSKPECFELSIK